MNKRIVLVLSLFFLTITSVALAIQAPNGCWSGAVTDVFVPFEDYDADVCVFYGTPLPHDGSSVYYYPNFTCYGDLDWNHDTRVVGQSVFDETPASGICIPGTVRLTYSSGTGKMFYEWFYPNGTKDAEGWLDPV